MAADIVALADHPALISLKFSWLGDGVLTAVRNQGRCSCCWIIAGEGAVEALNKIRHPRLPLIQNSVQEVLDCYKGRYPKYANIQEDHMGCFNHSIQGAFTFMKDFGVCEESKYSFKARRGNCRANQVKSFRMRIWDFQKLSNKVDSHLIESAIRRQPIAAGMYVHRGDPEIQNLGRRVYQNIQPKPGKRYKHAILIVGFGPREDGIQGEDVIPYFLIKNSWGTDWGIEGFGKIRRDLIFAMSYPLRAYKRRGVV